MNPVNICWTQKSILTSKCKYSTTKSTQNQKKCMISNVTKFHFIYRICTISFLLLKFEIILTVSRLDLIARYSRTSSDGTAKQLISSAKSARTTKLNTFILKINHETIFVVSIVILIELTKYENSYSKWYHHSCIEWKTIAKIDTKTAAVHSTPSVIL